MRAGKKLSLSKTMAVTNTRGKLKIIAFVIVLILLFTSILLFLHSSQVSRSESVLKVGTFAFYYPWYGTPSVSGYWHHWNAATHNPDSVTDGRRDIAATDYPLLDVYDSNNETVIGQHVKWAKEAGVDCFVLSWWGINDFTDNASKHIRNVCEQDDFNFTFYIENTSSVNQTVQDLSYLLSEYGNSSSWYRIDGKPVIFIYQRVRDNLKTQAWIWHACNDNIGIDLSPNMNKSASTQWMLSEDVRKPPRFGIIPFQPFMNESGYVESASSITLQSNEQYWLNVGVSNIRNDSATWSDVGIKIKIGLDNSCNVTLNPNTRDQIVNFNDGWQDWKFNITSYAGHDIYIKAESYNDGSVKWSSEWAAIDYFYITDSSGKIVSPDPFLDNGWKEVMEDIWASGAKPYVIMDFGGYEGNVRNFIDYFSDCIDGIHMYNPVCFSKNLSEVYDLYWNASELAHSYDKIFTATVVPGFDNVIVSDNSSAALENVVERQNGTTYSSFWLIAQASYPDGYAITSFNEWHEGTEIEPSIEYGSQYLHLTRIPRFSSILPSFVIAAVLMVIVYQRQRGRMVQNSKNK